MKRRSGRTWDRPVQVADRAVVVRVAEVPVPARLAGAEVPAAVVVADVAVIKFEVAVFL